MNNEPGWWLALLVLLAAAILNCIARWANGVHGVEMAPMGFWSAPGRLEATAVLRAR